MSDHARQIDETSRGSAVRTSDAVMHATLHTPAADGPGDPSDVARALALCVAEILTGGRELDTIARWVTKDVYRMLQQRVAFARRARSVRRQLPSRAGIRVGSVLISSPAPGIADAAVVIHTRARTRAVAIRLETREGRWRATCVGML